MFKKKMNDPSTWGGSGENLYGQEYGERLQGQDLSPWTGRPRDRFGFGVPVSSKAFNEIKGMVDDDGMDVGKFLNSKAYEEWLQQEYKPSDDRMIKGMLESIIKSYDNEEEGMLAGRKFLGIIKELKPGNPMKGG